MGILFVLPMVVKAVEHQVHPILHVITRSPVDIHFLILSHYGLALCWAPCHSAIPTHSVTGLA